MFYTAAHNSKPGPLSQESDGLPPSHCATSSVVFNMFVLFPNMSHCTGFKDV